VHEEIASVRLRRREIVKIGFFRAEKLPLYDQGGENMTWDCQWDLKMCRVGTSETLLDDQEVVQAGFGMATTSCSPTRRSRRFTISLTFTRS
jgi:hypothetical protein